MGVTPKPVQMLTLPVLVARYAFFAALATLANLGAQRVVLHLGQGLGYPALAYGAAVIVGTGAGLVLKYALDKRWIFYDSTAGAKAQGDSSCSIPRWGWSPPPSSGAARPPSG
jgi:putative flippase GtrA